MAAARGSRVVALGGVMAALAVISLYMSSILPFNRYFFYGLSSVFCAVVIIESGVKAGWMFYAATSLLSILIIPDKPHVIPYILFFGIYGIVKYFAEKRVSFNKFNQKALEFSIKLGFFNIMAILSFYLASTVLALPIFDRFPLWAVLAGANVVFLIFDYAYTSFIGFYYRRIKRA